MKEMKVIAGGLILVLLILTGCTTTQKGAGIGAATGAVLGTIIGHQSGKEIEGAAIGAAVGGITGAAIGKKAEPAQPKEPKTTQ
ncbi:MAG: hypothetical protein GXO98_08125 [Nitrospirae bacterium]|nr:hypothetical protein [Nitrospirota bacterium]